jgi:polyhydroxyalkanoate synthesis regulator phasin
VRHPSKEFFNSLTCYEQRPGKGIRRLSPRSSTSVPSVHRFRCHSCPSSRNALSLREREGWRSLRKAAIPAWLSPILQGVTLLSIVRAAWTLSSKLTAIETRLDQQAEQLKTLTGAVLDPQQGMAVRLARIEEKVTRLDEWSKSISSKIVRSDYEKKLTELNARIDYLERQLSWVSASLRDSQADLANERQRDRRIRDAYSAFDSELSVISNELVSVSRSITFPLPDTFSADEWKGKLPEDYVGYLRERIESLRQRIEGLKNRSPRGVVSRRSLTARQSG